MNVLYLLCSNHSEEFILTTIGALEKGVEGSEANLLIETNGSMCILLRPRSKDEFHTIPPYPLISR